MQLNAKTTALVLIDLQKGVLAMPVLPHPASTVYARSKQLASRLRTAGGPIVWVRVSFAGDFADAPRGAPSTARISICSCGAGG
jgi:nicotinamidase-related amidase